MLNVICDGATTKLLYMTIDGVAPSEKINQQLSRCFRAAKDATSGCIFAEDKKDFAQKKVVKIAEMRKPLCFIRRRGLEKQLLTLYWGSILMILLPTWMLCLYFLFRHVMYIA